jgi:hypothetical protein
MPPLLHDALTDTINLSFEQTVPRSLVHKRSLENVLLTEISAYADDQFICAGRVPTAHRFFNDAGRTPHTDILFYTELGRQASLAVSHQFLDVSKDDVFIFEGSHASLGTGAWIAPQQPSPDSVIVQIRAREIARRKNDAVSRVVADHVMWIGGEQVFTGTGAWTVQPAALFQRLRRSSGAHAAAAVPAPVDPDIPRARLQSAAGINVVISAPHTGAGEGLVASLLVDDTHPYFFDHACDHVPGMLLLEGCAQLALVADAAAGDDGDTRVASYEMTFAQFVERHIPATLTARLDGGYAGAERRVSIGITQNGTECGRAIIGLRSAAR